MNEQIAAIHEAGHAVAYRRLFPGGAQDATLNPIGDGDAYRPSHGTSYIEEFPEDAIDQALRDADVISCCAGYAATLVAGFLTHQNSNDGTTRAGFGARGAGARKICPTKSLLLAAV